MRTLRVLATTSIPLSQAELARRAAVTLSALPDLLANLESAGVIAYEGRGRTRQVLFRHRHPLMPLLAQLFRQEEHRWVNIQNQLRDIVRTNVPDVICAWIGGPVTVRHDRFADPLVLGIISETLPAGVHQEGARKQANIVQSAEHVIIALRFYQRADLLRFTPAQIEALTTAIVLYGPAPLDILGVDTAVLGAPGPVNSLRGPGKYAPSVMAFASRIADRLVKDPEILAGARTFIERRLPLAGDVERLALLEWQGLLGSLTPGQIAALLREDSERADVLRQNLPFHGALSSDDREELRAAGRGARARRP
ncbi:MAG: hypothetical protein ACT4P6_00310 [Gemmatimonadaceae bacterium]